MNLPKSETFFKGRDIYYKGEGVPLIGSGNKTGGGSPPAQPRLEVSLHEPSENPMTSVVGVRQIALTFMKIKLFSIKENKKKKKHNMRLTFFNTYGYTDENTYVDSYDGKYCPTTEEELPKFETLDSFRNECGFTTSAGIENRNKIGSDDAIATNGPGTEAPTEYYSTYELPIPEPEPSNPGWVITYDLKNCHQKTYPKPDIDEKYYTDGTKVTIVIQNDIYKEHNVIDRLSINGMDVSPYYKEGTLSYTIKDGIHEDIEVVAWFSHKD